MQFVNNWQRDIVLPLAADQAALDLPDGQYRLTLTNKAGTLQEVVGAAVVAGTAALSRGLEGTARADWPAGSVIYCALTAGLFQSLCEDVTALEQANALLTVQLAELASRVTVLEGGSSTLLVDSAGNQLVDNEGKYLEVKNG